MSTTTMGAGTVQNHELRARTRVHVGSFGIGSVGVAAALVATWGAIAPYIGPTFGYDADGSSSWHWSLTHSMLALVPGALGLLLGITILAETRGITAGRRRVSLATIGLLLMACGAWFVVGPLAWPVLTSHAGYFVPTSPLRFIANEIGYSLGTGVVLAICGGFVAGWASRHQIKASAPVTGGNGAVST
jgi:hypothetical protein